MTYTHNSETPNVTANCYDPVSNSWFPEINHYGT